MSTNKKIVLPKDQATTLEKRLKSSDNGSLQKYKIVALGDTGVGKTSIITRFLYDTFDTAYQSTVGIDFVSKTVIVNEKAIRLQIWDTAGQERFKSLVPGYVRGCDVAVIVFDLSDVTTLTHCKDWANLVRNEKGDDVILYIVGNKADLCQTRKVTQLDAEKVANELNATFLETSAKHGYNIDKLFNTIAMTLPGLSTQEEESCVKVNLSAQKPKAAEAAAKEGNCAC
ncbi:hypothetical protein WA158_003890 [Blastocystis sp. Blastoise]